MSAPRSTPPSDLLVDLAVKHLNPLCLHLDRELRLVRAFGDAAHYGYDAFVPGVDCAEQLEILYGIDQTEAIELPLVTTRNGGAASVYITPRDDGLDVVLVDTTAERDRQREVQQRANELELLSERQTVLVEALNAAKEELQVKRREAEDASHMKSRFIANMSHEFRTPLTSILGYSQLREQDPPDSPAAHKRLAAVERAAKHLLNLVENLLTQAQLEIGDSRLNLGPLSPAALLQEMKMFFEPIAAVKGLTLDVGGAAGLPDFVVADEMRLRQVLINLLGNACKYTSAGSVSLSFRWVAGRLSFRVADTGPGIAKERQEAIFKPFHRAGGRGESGAGLGLGITRQIVSLMDGTLKLDSAPGSGTVIDISVAAAALSGHDGDPGAMLDHSPDPGLVLLAEDDPDVGDIVRAYLEAAGCQVVTASTGREALDLAGHGRPDLVIMDLNLPDMDGAEVVKRLRDADFRKPVIMLTASTMQVDRERALAAGCDEFLFKPVIIPQLVGLVRRLIGRTRDSRE